MKVEFADGFAVGFKMAVPEAFQDSLNKETFDTGDLIYDDRRAYGPWDEAIKHVGTAFQVVKMVGDDIEYRIYVRKCGSHELPVAKTTTESVAKFIDRLRLGT